MENHANADGSLADGFVRLKTFCRIGVGSHFVEWHTAHALKECKYHSSIQWPPVRLKAKWFQSIAEMPEQNEAETLSYGLSIYFK